MEKDIKVLHKTQEKVGGKWVDKNVFPEDMIDIKVFEESFVNEMWNNEIRSNEEYTKYGYFHTKTTVYRDKNYRSVRTFVFPE